MKTHSNVRQLNLVTGSLDEPAHGPGYGLDARLDEVLPGDPRAWPREERELFTEKVVQLLVDDMLDAFAAHHARDADGRLVFADEADRREFGTLLGWACGYWQGHVPFDLAMRLFGFNPREAREDVLEAYGRDLYLAREALHEHLRLH